MFAVGLHVDTHPEMASRLRPTRIVTDGTTLVAMLAAIGRDEYRADGSKQALFVSGDNYVIDGHHRLAALVGLRGGDTKVWVEQVVGVRSLDVLALVADYIAYMGIQED